MMKQCIYCPNDFYTPARDYGQSLYGVCSDCERKQAVAREANSAATVGMELLALVSDSARARTRNLQ
jgi:hypothetical protein